MGLLTGGTAWYCDCGDGIKEITPAKAAGAGILAWAGRKSREERQESVHVPWCSGAWPEGANPGVRLYGISFINSRVP